MFPPPTNSLRGGCREDSEEESSCEDGPHSAAVELAMHIEDCASMLPGYLIHIEESLRGIAPDEESPLPKGEGGLPGGMESFPPPQEDSTGGLGREGVYERLRGLTSPTVVATLHIRAARSRIGGGDPNLTAPPRSARVSFNFMEGFRLHPDVEVVAREGAHSTCYESLLSLLLGNFWDAEREA
ncbi:unnamed protein product [Phytomonas sp. EM1]|nr:unnamed protein product [Phytomonas sp. EM1]|eukprot:CCW64530.1 unnamed protein product [Phytomonas sp. isolate EM1]